MDTMPSPTKRRGKKPDTPCSVCGKLLYTSPGSLPPERRTCQACRAIKRAEQAAASGFERSCAECDRPFSTRYKRQRFCSEPCQVSNREFTPERKAAMRRRRSTRRARLVTATVENFDHRDIFERDQWRCGICGRPTSAKPWPHPLAATLDHIVPLSKGGDHSPANTQCAHARCNLSKSDRALHQGEQLRLIG